MRNITLILSKGLAVLCALLVSILYANSSSAQGAPSSNVNESLIKLAQAKSKSQQGKISADKRPNILIIVADDMGWSDI